MKNKIFKIGIFVLLLIISGNVLAVSKESNSTVRVTSKDLKSEVAIQGQTQVQAGQADLIAEESSSIQIQNKNEVKNQGDSSQIRNEEKEGVDGDENNIEEEKSDKDKDKNEGAERSLERRSTVATAVQEIIKATEDTKGGIGEQVRVIAQAQNNNQNEVEAKIQKVEERNAFSKFLFGVSYGELKNAKKILENSKEEIVALDELKDKITDKKDLEVINSQIEAIKKVITETEAEIESSDNGFSLLGWMFKLFNK